MFILSIKVVDLSVMSYKTSAKYRDIVKGDKVSCANNGLSDSESMKGFARNSLDLTWIGIIDKGCYVPYHTYHIVGGRC